MGNFRMLKMSNFYNKFLKQSVLKRFISQKVMLTGGGGQVGQILYPELCERYGSENVLVTDLKPNDMFKKFEKLDALNAEQVKSTMKSFKPDIVIHLPS